MDERDIKLDSQQQVPTQESGREEKAADRKAWREEPDGDARSMPDEDFDSRYIWDEYKKVLYEAVPQDAHKKFGFGHWVGLGVCALSLLLALTGWLRGGKLLLPAGAGETQSILSAQELLEQRQGEPEPEEQEPEPGAQAGGQGAGAAAETYVPTAILADGKVAGVLASQEAAYALLEDVKTHFGAMAQEKAKGELAIEVKEEVTFRAAEEGEEAESYETLFERFTGSRSPIRVQCTVTSKSSEAVEFKTSEEKDKYLVEGTSIVVSDGRPGAKVTISHTVYINGDKSTTRSNTETQSIKPQDRVVRIGTQEIDKEADPEKREGRKGPDTDLSFQSPMEEAQVSSNYGQRQGVLHMGLDYVAKEGGSLDVLASCSGVVAAVMERGGYGLMVEIDHGEGFTSRYAHLASVSVALGDTVSAGQTIGQAGQSGNAEAVHLHFELRVKGEAYNPRYYLD